MTLPSEVQRGLMLKNAPLGSSTPYELQRALEPLMARVGTTLVQMCGFGVIKPFNVGSRAALYALVACMTLSHAISPRGV